MPDFGLNSWTTGDLVDAATDVRVASATGYRFVELRDAKIERYLAQGGELEALRERAREAGISILSVNTLDDCTLHDGAQQAALAERCRQLCAWARDLAAPNVIVGPSYQPEPAIDAATVQARTVYALRSYAEIAAQQGVAIAFEFQGYARCSINNVNAAMAVLEELDAVNVSLLIDAFHFYVGGSRFEELALLDPRRLAIVHLADVDHGDRARLGKPNRVLPGDGVLPLKELVATIKRLGYRGAYSLELFREEYWAMDPMIVAAKGIESMRRFV